jgi:hypothetical protein
MPIQEGSTMKLTRKVIAGVLIAGFLAMILAVPQVSDAAGRHWKHGGGGHRHGHHGGHHGPGPFWGGLAVGAVTGIVVGSIFVPRVYAAPPPVVYQPAPPPVVYYQPVCSSYWVDTHWNGYHWVPGYWAQACR